MSGGCKLDLGGRGSCLNNILDFIIEHSVTRQNPKCLHHRENSAWLVKNLLSGLLHIFVLGNCPSYVHIGSTTCDKCSQAFPILGHSSASVYYIEHKQKNRNVGGLEMRQVCSYKHTEEVGARVVGMHIIVSIQRRDDAVIWKQQLANISRSRVMKLSYILYPLAPIVTCSIEWFL